MGGGPKGYISESAKMRQFSNAWNDIQLQRELGYDLDIPAVLRTPEGLRKIVAMLTRNRQMKDEDIELLEAWIALYREANP